MTRSRNILAPRRYWSAAEVALLSAMYPHCHTADVAAWIGRTQGQCYQQAAARGLRKSAEYLASDTACRVKRGQQNEAMRAHRFKPGQPAWNKGLKGVVGVQEACRATQFKKGRPACEARNYVPVGSLRICADGYLERKVTDDPTIFPARRWVAVHRLVWEAHRGPIPPGYIVRFRAGQKTTVLEQIAPDRLECITRIDNMRRNSVHTQYPPEVARLVQLRGALNRQINRRQQEQSA